MSAHRDLLFSIEETLSLLEKTRDGAPDGPVPEEPLPSLLRDCEAACAALDAAVPEPVRTVHHFACSGGTILSRCIAAMPNTVLLSEIDPFSTLAQSKVQFSPRDLLQQSQTGLRQLDDTGVAETFLASVGAMYKANSRTGRRLVIRDHTHSHFCTGVDPHGRPTLRKVLQERFPLRSLVTVRHPLDSFMSMSKNGWVMFEPETLDEYCRRYTLFLDAYDDVPVLRYEDFVSDPDRGVAKIAKILSLPINVHWREILPIIVVTGDSGRKGDKIAARARQTISTELTDACRASQFYNAVCTRLGYDPAPDAGWPNSAAE